MRLLVLGAGATGGYFGGRLLQHGQDITFLVRPARAEQLRKGGLIIRSPLGDAVMPSPAVVTAASVAYDLILLSCKAYDLDSAIRAITPAVGKGTAILPILNGMSHLERLDRHFGADSVLGGLCLISSTLAPDGAIVQLTNVHGITFGERNGESSERCPAIENFLKPGNFSVKVSENIMHDMWEKWVVLATLASATCLMRADIGTIVSAPGGNQLVLQLLDECCAVSRAYGCVPDSPFFERSRQVYLDPRSNLAASMYRDVQRGGPVEADHVIGDMIAKAKVKDVDVPVLRAAYCNLKCYETQRGKATKAQVGASR